MISDLRISSVGLPSPGVGISKPIDASQFSDLFRDSVGEVDNLERTARVAIHGLMNGSGADVHQALIASEKATAAFELALAMRNKAIQCYQAVMSMQF